MGIAHWNIRIRAWEKLRLKPLLFHTRLLTVASVGHRREQVFLANDQEFVTVARLKGCVFRVSSMTVGLLFFDTRVLTVNFV